MSYKILNAGIEVKEPEIEAWLNSFTTLHSMMKIGFSAEIREQTTAIFEMRPNGALRLGFRGPIPLVSEANEMWSNSGASDLFPEFVLDRYLANVPNEETLGDDWIEWERATFPAAMPQAVITYEHKTHRDRNDRLSKQELHMIICQNDAEAADFPLIIEMEQRMYQADNPRTRHPWPGATAFCSNLDCLETHGEEFQFTHQNVVYYFPESVFAADLAERFYNQLAGNPNPPRKPSGGGLIGRLRGIISPRRKS